MPQAPGPIRSRLRATTSLSPAQVHEVAASAAAGARGNWTHGRQRVSLLRSAGSSDVYEVRDALGTRRLMLLRVVAGRKDGRTNVRVDVDEAALLTPTRLTRIKAPRALAQHTFGQFLTALADGIRAADAEAKVTVREDLGI